MKTDELKSRLSAQMPDVIATLRAKADGHGTIAHEGYTIQNATGKEAVVRIYDEIWSLGVNALDFTTDLDAITAPEIRVEINSPGGNVFDGIAIYNALRMHPAKVTTRVDGIAASIASVIAQAGDHRVMVDSSQMMIHNAWGMVVGNKADHEEMAALLEQQDAVIAGIYATASDNDPDHFLGLMNAETWMTAEQAVEHGLADEIYKPERQPADRLIDKIDSAASAVHAALDGAEGLVAARADAGCPLTGAKRDGLVALRAELVRIDDLLQQETGPSDAHDAKAALAKRVAAFQASLPSNFLG